MLTPVFIFVSSELYFFFFPLIFVGMNQFNQMGMQMMSQRSIPPLPPNPQMNQVSVAVFVMNLVLYHPE